MSKTVASTPTCDEAAQVLRTKLDPNPGEFAKTVEFDSRFALLKSRNLHIDVHMARHRLTSGQTLLVYRVVLEPKHLAAPGTHDQLANLELALLTDGKVSHNIPFEPAFAPARVPVQARISVPIDTITPTSELTVVMAPAQAATA
jgi:hypothetical protein